MEANGGAFAYSTKQTIIIPTAKAAFYEVLSNEPPIFEDEIPPLTIDAVINEVGELVDPADFEAMSSSASDPEGDTITMSF